MIYIIVIIAILILFGGSSSNSQTGQFGNAGEHMSIFNKGFSLAGGLRAITVEQSFRNSLVVGNSGSGKTSAILISTLFTLARGRSSVIVLDVSKEIYKLTSGYLSKNKGRKIFCFDLSETSDGFNPLQLAKSTDDLDKIAQVLIKNSGVESKSDPYWSSSSEMVISLFLQYIFFYAQDKEKNMFNLVLLLETYMAEPAKIDLLFVQCNDEKLLRGYKALNAIPEKTRSSIISVALTATKLFKSTAVARCTGRNTFDLETFRNEPCILYLCIPLNLLKFLAPLTALVFEIFFQQVLSKIPPRGSYNIFFLIDEMLTMKLDLGLLYPQCRKYSVGVMSLIQEEKMLGLQFNQAESFAIKSNSSSRVYMPGQSFTTCKELQEEIGKTIQTEESPKQRPGYIMEASEIRMMKDEAIIMISSSQPLKERIRPYYSHFIYQWRTQIPPYEAQVKIPFAEPPMIQM